MTDRMWACTQSTTSRRLAARTPVYHYEFADPAPPPLSPAPPTMPLSAQHASDLWSFFDLTEHAAPLHPGATAAADPDDRLLVGLRGEGDPGPDWPRVTRHPHVQSLPPSAITGTDLATTHHCAFWDNGPMG